MTAHIPTLPSDVQGGKYQGRDVHLDIAEQGLRENTGKRISARQKETTPH